MLVQLFNKTITLLERALDLRSERHRIVSANIANQDTPGYKSKELRFKEALHAASGTQASPPLIKTDPAHLSTQIPPAVSPHVTLTASSGSTRLDGNTVNGEMEMAKLAENTLMYNATAQLVASKLKGFKNAIREGR